MNIELSIDINIKNFDIKTNISKLLISNVISTKNITNDTNNLT